jgi:hypothetical protein
MSRFPSVLDLFWGVPQLPNAFQMRDLMSCDEPGAIDSLFHLIHREEKQGATDVSSWGWLGFARFSEVPADWFANVRLAKHGRICGSNAATLELTFATEDLWS